MRWNYLKKWLTTNWFLAVLALVLLIGFGLSPQLHWLGEQHRLRDLNIASVLFLMSLMLSPGSIRETIRYPGPALLGCGINFIVLPLLSLLAVYGLPNSYAVGIAVAVAAPSTLASGAVWTRNAGGNFATAILVTILTNASCFIVTPLLVQFLTSHLQPLGDVTLDIQSKFSLGAMIQNLALLIVLPMVLGQILHSLTPLGEWSLKRKTLLSILAQCGILFVVLLGSIKNGENLRIEKTPLGWLSLIHMLAVVNVLHIGALWFGWWLAGWMRIAYPNRIAIAISGSQKTLMVGLFVAGKLEVSILPALSFHVCQLIVDTVIAQRLQRIYSSNRDNGQESGGKQ